MGDRMCQCGHYESDHGADGSCDSSASTGYCPCFIFDDSDAQPDPRDAEIARLKDRANEALAACERKDREIARLKHTNEALEHVLRQYEKRHGVDGLIKGHIEAATIDQRHEVGMMLVDLARHKRALAAGPAAVRRQENVDVNTREAYARVVEVAQAAAMKEKP